VTVIEEKGTMEASPTEKRIDDLSGRVSRFEGRFERFEDKVDGHFEKLEARLDGVATKEQMNERFDVVDGRFAMVGTRLEMVDGRFDVVDTRLERMEARFDRWDKIVTAVGVSIAGGVVSIAGTVVYKVLGL
jgi:archaellum component FlaC